MSSQEEEMSDVLEDDETVPASNPVAPNKPEPSLFDQYREQRKAEDAENDGERELLESRLRACLVQNPKIEIGKPSAMQEKVDAMDLPALRRAVTAAEDQVGFSSTTVIPKTSLRILNQALQRTTGMYIDPNAMEDTQLLHVIARNMPTISWRYADATLIVSRLLEFLRFPTTNVETPTEVEGDGGVDQ